jgi:(S)-citramalyl-CoA lyase
MRSVLFVPGSRPERFAKALAVGADGVIIDFEDAVEESLKAQARMNLEHFLQDNPEARVLVRINAPDHPEHSADIACCAVQPGVAAIILPKVESRAQVEALAVSGKPVWPLIESARGLLAIPEIVQARHVERLTFGALDLSVDLGLRNATQGAAKILDYVRYTLLIHSVSAGLAPPIDTVYANLSDLDGLAHIATSAKEMGFGGLLCIHPAQVPVVHQAFQLSEDEIAWARRVVEAARSGAGAIRLNGQMIDAPVIRSAQRLLESLETRQRSPLLNAGLAKR